MMINNQEEKICMIYSYDNADLLPTNLEKMIYYALEDLVENKGVTCFLTGNSGMFDAQANTAIYILKKRFSHVRLHLILPYKTPRYFYIRNSSSGLYDDIIFSINEMPEPREVIRRNNEFMVTNSNCLLTFLHPTDRFSSVYETYCYAQKLKQDIFHLRP